MAISKIGSDALAAGAPSRSQLPAGTVLQVVNATFSTNTTSSSTTFSDTGLSATITPTSSTSKILVRATIPFYKNTGNVVTGVSANIVRNNSSIYTWLYYGTWNNIDNRARAGYSCDYLDSPASTSALTYKIQAAISEAGSNVVMSWCHDNSTAFLTLMEIAA